MKSQNRTFRTFLVAALLLVAASAALAQIQGAQTLSTTTLSSAVGVIGSGNISSVTLASLTNVTATVSIGTRLWVDTEAMDVVTNSVPASGTTILVQRGAAGTKAEGHASGRRVYVSRPNIFQGYDVAGTCWTNSAATQLPTLLPWINLTSGNRFDCKADGNWFRSGVGSAGSGAVTLVPGFCTGTVGSAQTEYLNGAACSGATTATYSFVISSPGELANLYVNSSAAVTGGTSKDVLTVYKNGTATAVTCTIAAAATSCSDITNGVATVAGDYIQFQFVTATSDTAANISVSLGLYGQ
jgi:hypothetical protein